MIIARNLVNSPGKSRSRQDMAVSVLALSISPAGMLLFPFGRSQRARPTKSFARLIPKENKYWGWLHHSTFGCSLCIPNMNRSLSSLCL
ncbi:hypothetical protein BDW75DRAFT_204237 [Aspergillus navahoensis]